MSAATAPVLLDELKRLYSVEAAFASVRAAVEDDSGLWSDGERLARVRGLVEGVAR